MIHPDDRGADPGAAPALLRHRRALRDDRADRAARRRDPLPALERAGGDGRRRDAGADAGTCIDVTEQVLAEREREAAALHLNEVRPRRRQAVEINDNIVQGLTAAVMPSSSARPELPHLEATLAAARAMMGDTEETPAASPPRATSCGQEAATLDFKPVPREPSGRCDGRRGAPPADRPPRRRGVAVAADGRARAAREGGFAAVAANDHLLFPAPGSTGRPPAACRRRHRDASGPDDLRRPAELRGPLPWQRPPHARRAVGRPRRGGRGAGPQRRTFSRGRDPTERWRLLDDALGSCARAHRDRSRARLTVPPVRARWHPAWVASWGSLTGLRRVARPGRLGGVGLTTRTPRSGVRPRGARRRTTRRRP